MYIHDTCIYIYIYSYLPPGPKRPNLATAATPGPPAAASRVCASRRLSPWLRAWRRPSSLERGISPARPARKG